MGGVSKTVKKITKAVSKPFEQVAKAVTSPLKKVVGSVMPDAPDVHEVTAPAPAAADVSVAATTAGTDIADTSKRKGLMRSAKGKKSLTVSRAAGGGLNV